MKKKAELAIRFVNNKGEAIDIASNATLDDLVKLGVRDIRFAEPEAPIADGWWQNKDNPYKEKQV